MATILSLSSQVLRGAIGNSAARFALERLGHEVWAVPTTILSNHPGHADYAGRAQAPDAIGEMLDALARNGWLGDVDALISGYMPSAGHARLCAAAIDRLRAVNPRARVLVDPALGDDPKGVYIDAGAAEAIRRELVPRADIVTPNRFELEWLSGARVSDRRSAGAAAGELACNTVLVTSVPGASAGELVNLLVSGGTSCCAVVERREGAPHGTGDLMAALCLGHSLAGAGMRDALALATAGVEAVLEASLGADELRLVASQDTWSAPEPWPITGDAG